MHTAYIACGYRALHSVFELKATIFCRRGQSVWLRSAGRGTAFAASYYDMVIAYARMVLTVAYIFLSLVYDVYSVMASTAAPVVKQMLLFES